MNETDLHPRRKKARSFRLTPATIAKIELLTHYYGIDGGQLLTYLISKDYHRIDRRETYKPKAD